MNEAYCHIQARGMRVKTTSSGSAGPTQGPASSIILDLTPPLFVRQPLRPRALLVCGTLQGLSSCMPSTTLNENGTSACASLRGRLLALLDDLGWWAALRVLASGRRTHPSRPPRLPSLPRSSAKNRLESLCVKSCCPLDGIFLRTALALAAL